MKEFYTTDDEDWSEFEWMTRLWYHLKFTEIKTKTYRRASIVYVDANCSKCRRGNIVFPPCSRGNLNSPVAKVFITNHMNEILALLK